MARLNLLRGAASIGLVVLLWSLAGRFALINTDLVPTPELIWQAGVELCNDGYRIQEARQFIRTDRMFVGLVELGVLGALPDAAFVQISCRLVHWEQS